MNRIVLALFLVVACSFSVPEEKSEQVSVENLKVKARELAQKFIITDGQIDFPYHRNGFNIESNKEILISTKKKKQSS